MISIAGLHQLTERIVDAGSIDALELPGVSPERAEVVAGGHAILLATMESLDIDQMRVSDGALREGVLYDLLGRLSEDDVRDRTVEQMQLRYDVDIEHAERVRDRALGFYEAVKTDWDIDDDVHRALLKWAADIHEVGLAIAHSGYYKHGSYLVENSDMPGFCREDQQLLWALVRSHRRSFKLHRFANGVAPMDRVAPRLAILLRLAALLSRARTNGGLPQVTLHAPDEDTLRVVFEGAWLDRAPMTQADLDDETNYLANAGFELRVESTPKKG